METNTSCLWKGRISNLPTAEISILTNLREILLTGNHHKLE